MAFALPSEGNSRIFAKYERTTVQTLLQIKTSLFSDNGESSRLAHRFVVAWRDAHPGVRVVVRDLARDPVPHLDATRFGAFVTKPEDRTNAQAEVLRYSDALIQELKEADVLVIGVPMYNFGIPSTLKAYFDHIARAGVTFRYTEKGPVGLLTGKKAFVFAARGGRYSGTPLDTQTPYLRNVLTFLGISDVEFVFAEGLAMGTAAKEQAVAKASAQAEALALPALAATA
jgi:FMN-dependent NADH-azoreductase